MDGRPVATTKGRRHRPVRAGTQTLQVQIPRRQVTLALVVENRHGASDPATLVINWEGHTPQQKAKPVLYLWAIGVGDYQDDTFDLRYAAKDARDFVNVLKERGGDLYRKIVVRLLTDDEATRATILGGLEWLEKKTTNKDVAMVFLSGHGTNNRRGAFYFLPHNYRDNRLKSFGVPFHDFKSTMEMLEGKVLFFVDACHSGNLRGGMAAVDNTRLANVLASEENGVVVFTSAAGNQLSHEHDRWRNGAFTKALVEGLRGKAALFGHNEITVSYLNAYISTRVKELTEGLQEPVMIKPGTIPDFAITAKQ